MVPEQNIIALKTFVSMLRGHHISWALIGSMNLALQGIDVEVHDIDIHTTKEGALEIGALLKEYNTEPVRYSETEQFRSYRGIFTLSGVKIDVVGDMQHKTPDGEWITTVRSPKPIILKIRDFSVPAKDLKHEYHAYLSMGRLEKAKKIKKFLDANKPKDPLWESRSKKG